VFLWIRIKREAKFKLNQVYSIALLGDDSLAVAAGVAEDLARVEAARDEEDAEGEAAEEEDHEHGDPAHHAHLFGDGSHALRTAELALSHKGSSLFSLYD